MDKLSCQVLTVDDVGLEGAVDLLWHFFVEEGVFRRLFIREVPYVPCLPGEGRDLFRP